MFFQVSNFLLVEKFGWLWLDIFRADWSCSDVVDAPSLDCQLNEALKTKESLCALTSSSMFSGEVTSNRRATFFQVSNFLLFEKLGWLRLDIFRADWSCSDVVDAPSLDCQLNVIYDMR